MLEQALSYRGNFVFRLHLRSYGVTVRIESNTRELLEDARRVAIRALAGHLEIIDNDEGAAAEHSFGLAVDESGTFFMFRNGEQFTHSMPPESYFCRDPKLIFMRFFNSMLRIAVAEHAGSHVFVHAGVIGWNGSALIFPAKSFQGKTTLVAELVKRGAEYYSDEYAVFDEYGLVHPFPRDLSIRYFDEFEREKDVPVSELGGRSGSGPLPAGMVLLTGYGENARWDPQVISGGSGILELLQHTVPARTNTEFVLKTLNKALSRAIIARSPRGEAPEAAEVILSYFDNCINKN